MKSLDATDIESKFKKLPVEWSLLAGNRLERDYKFDDFKQALDFVNQVGDVAESINHHPDITLSYGKVELSVTTHSAGGLTNKDFEFAEAIEKIDS